MARVHFTSKRFEIMVEATEANKVAAEMAYTAYLSGQVSLKRYLNAQRDYTRAKDELAATEGRRAAHTARLFRSLGGGELVGVPSKRHYKTYAEKGFWSFMDKDPANQ